MTEAEDKHVLLHSKRDGLPAVIVVNESFAKQHVRADYPWHLSIILKPQEFGDNGMPASTEGIVLFEEGDRIEGAVVETGKARFLARITWNNTRRLLFRVSDPEPVNAALQRLISEKREAREWEYRMWEDPEWNEGKWFVSALANVS